LFILFFSFPLYLLDFIHHHNQGDHILSLRKKKQENNNNRKNERKLKMKKKEKCKRKTKKRKRSKVKTHFEWGLGGFQENKGY